MQAKCNETAGELSSSRITSSLRAFVISIWDSIKGCGRTRGSEPMTELGVLRGHPPHTEMSPWTHSLQVVSCGLELKACVDKHPWGPWDSLMSHLVLIKPREPICLQFRMILPCVKLKKEKKKKTKKPFKIPKNRSGWESVNCFEHFPSIPSCVDLFFLVVISFVRTTQLNYRNYM